MVENTNQKRSNQKIVDKSVQLIKNCIFAGSK